VPSGGGTRPTSDRTREALFSSLASLLDLDGARVLDLFAGSGAVGLEALSRGAGHALFVESDNRAAALIRQNARTLNLNGARVRAERVQKVVGNAPDAPYDLVFADPPYAFEPAELDATLASLAANGWLAEGGIVVLERRRDAPEPVWPVPLKTHAYKRYGDTALWYGHAT
jgi:16S rRNA (guanine966-N2)-methyltransferase